MKADLSSSEDRCEQLRSVNISIMRRLHWFDQEEAEEKVQRQKARMEKEEEIRRNVRIEEEETERIREETRQRKSDSCSSINPFSFKHTA